MPEYLYTKEQTLKVLEAWDVHEPLPGKGKKIVIAFRPGSQFRLGYVEKTSLKSTYGKTLYKIVLSNDQPAIHKADEGAVAVSPA